MPNSNYSLALALVVSVLTGCVAHNPSPQAGTSDPCATLHAIIADYPNGFVSLRGKADHFASGTVYRATSELIAGHCQIWSWGQGDSAYLCAVTNPSLAIAKHRHQQALQTLQACLGEHWQEQGDWRERDGQTDGYASRFTASGSPATISLETTIQTGGPGQHFTNFLYVGNPPTSERADP